jgi:hypothetical protein
MCVVVEAATVQRQWWWREKTDQIRQDEWVIHPEQRLTFRVLLLQLLPLPCQRLSCLQHEAEGVMVMSALTFLQGCPLSSHPLDSNLTTTTADRPNQKWCPSEHSNPR